MVSTTQQIAISGSSFDISDYIPHVSEIFDDKRTLLQKVEDLVLSVLRELFTGCLYFFGVLKDCLNPSFDFVEAKKSWRTESKGLYVLIHGANGHPVTWQSHIDQLKDDQSKDVFVPYVPQRGNGPVEEVAASILKVVEEYAASHPKRPVCLIGVSRGGPICTWLETQMRISVPSTPVRISTIAAVHFGSSRMELVKWCHQLTGWSLGYDLSVVRELSFGSEKAKEILNNVLRPLPEGTTREFEFFASTEDLYVPEISSSMPRLGNHKVTYRVLHGHGHSSIVEEVSKDQIQACREWMDRY